MEARPPLLRSKQPPGAPDRSGPDAACTFRSSCRGSSDRRVVLGGAGCSFPVMGADPVGLVGSLISGVMVGESAGDVRGDSPVAWSSPPSLTESAGVTALESPLVLVGAVVGEVARCVAVDGGMIAFRREYVGKAGVDCAPAPFRLEGFVGNLAASKPVNSDSARALKVSSSWRAGSGDGPEAWRWWPADPRVAARPIVVVRRGLAAGRAIRQG